MAQTAVSLESPFLPLVMDGRHGAAQLILTLGRGVCAELWFSVCLTVGHQEGSSSHRTDLWGKILDW